MIKVMSIVGGCFNCGTGRETIEEVNLIKISNDNQESVQLMMCYKCAAELATKINSMIASPGLIPGSCLQVGDKICHCQFGKGVILGNRHKRGPAWYWHVGYNNGTFGYNSERNLTRIGTI